MNALHPSAPSQQLVNLKAFVAHGAQPARRAALPRTAASAQSTASNSLDVLRNARALELPAPPPPPAAALECPPYSEWSQHPELLQG